MVRDTPEHTDTNTIVRSGVWYISKLGYAEIIPGDTIRATGKVTPTLLGGKVVRIVMLDPTFEVMGHSRSVGAFHSGSVIIALGQWRDKWVSILEKDLPEPMSSLAAGILLGVKRGMPSDFYQNLVATGTMHIIAASGYNVSIVAAVIMRAMLMFASRRVAIALGMAGVIAYIVMAGAGASVVRAGIMGGLTLISFYWGRPTEAKRLLWISAGAMLLYNPLWLVDVGFQLSFMATAGILYGEPWIE
jgi:competence protein ComEC